VVTIITEWVVISFMVPITDEPSFKYIVSAFALE